MHMVGTLQGNGSPYRLNGTDPHYDYEYEVIDPTLPAKYQWYKLDEPVYSSRGVDYGGIYPFPQSYYSSWLGPVAEDAHPMSGVKDFEGSTYEELLDYQAYLQNVAIAYRDADPQIHVQNSIALPARYTGYENNGEGIENPDWEAHIKAGIMNYGALTTGIYWSGLNCEDQENYYYSGWDFTTVKGPEGEKIKVLKNMLPDNHSQNHEVVVVGWDDNYDRENSYYIVIANLYLFHRAGYAVKGAVDRYSPPTALTVLERLRPQPLCLIVDQLDTARRFMWDEDTFGRESCGTLQHQIFLRRIIHHDLCWYRCR